MLEWPAELPQRFLVEGYRETPPNRDRETAVELGPALAGSRASAAVRPIEGRMALRDWQVERLDRFYAAEARGRARVWRFPRPRLHGSPWLDGRGETVGTADGRPILISAHLMVRFTAPPDYPGSRNGVWWTVALSLEALP